MQHAVPRLNRLDFFLHDMPRYERKVTALVPYPVTHAPRIPKVQFKFQRSHARHTVVQHEFDAISFCFDGEHFVFIELPFHCYLNRILFVETRS